MYCFRGKSFSSDKINLKKVSELGGLQALNPGPRYVHVILVCGYLVLTDINSS